MESHILLGLTLIFVGCGESSSNDSNPAPAPVATTAPVDAATAGGDAAPASTTTPVGVPVTAPQPAATGEKQDALKLNSTALEYSFLQYDCGAIAAPLDTATVESQLKGVKTFQTLAATIPAKDQGLAKMTVVDNGNVCTYRALFAVNKNFSALTFASSQALTETGFTGCDTSKALLDSVLTEATTTLEYDKPLIRWVALRIPAGMQTAPLCSSGALRVVFSGAQL